MCLIVAGLGNPWARDDALGLRLLDELPPAAGQQRLFWGQLDALSLTQALLERPEPLLLIDGAELGLAPGAWRLLNATELGEVRLSARLSCHGFGLGEALGLVAALGRTAPLWLFLVQPADVQPGEGLSPDLIRCWPALSGALRKAVDAMLDTSIAVAP